MLVAMILGCCGCQDDSQAPTQASAPESAIVRRIQRASPLPLAPPDATNRVANDPAAAHLGQWLFFDTRLSGTGTFSCATCHDPQKDFSDGLPVAKAIETSSRHTPSLLNVAHHRWVGWDGRSDSIWAQALRPLEHPGEMGGNRVAIARLVATDPKLREAYEGVFGKIPFDVAKLPLQGMPGEDPDLRAQWESIAPETQHQITEMMANLGKALAAYQRLLENRDAPFDRYVASLDSPNANEAILTPSQLRGMEIFFGRGECWECHTGSHFSDGEFHNIGVPPPGGGLPRDPGRFTGSRIVKSDPFNAAGEFSDKQDGPWAKVVGNTRVDPETWGAFKTPSLRGVADTPPYMHAGQFATLEEVIRFYSTLEGAVQLDHHQEAVLTPLNLSDTEISDLEAFLGSLGGSDVSEELQISPQDPRFKPDIGTTSR